MLDPCLRLQRLDDRPMLRVFKFVWFALLAFVGFTLGAAELADSIEPSEADNSVTVQPNGYFEFSAKHHLNKDLGTYSDLIDLIFEITEEKLNSYRDEKNSQFEGLTTTATESTVEQTSNRPNRTWKRRILVLLDGERVTSTADRDMNLEEHLGTSLDSIESLEGFLSTDVDPNQIAYPRVLNFVTKPSILKESDKTPETRDSNVEELDDGKPQARVIFHQQS